MPHGNLLVGAGRFPLEAGGRPCEVQRSGPARCSSKPFIDGRRDQEILDASARARACPRAPDPVKVLERPWSLARDRGAFVELRPYAAGNPHSVTAQSRDEPCDERIGVGRGHRHQLSGPPRRERPDHAREARTDRTHRTDRDPQSDGGELRCRSGDGRPPAPPTPAGPRPGRGIGRATRRGGCAPCSARAAHHRGPGSARRPAGPGGWPVGAARTISSSATAVTWKRSDGGSGSTATSTSSDSTSLSASSMTASSCRVMATFG